MSFDKEDFDEIREELPLLSRAAAVPWLLDWMEATLHTGLKPLEWGAANLVLREDPRRLRGMSAILNVIHIRASDRQGRLVYSRSLDISDFSDETFRAVNRMVNRCEEWTSEQVFTTCKSRVTQLLYQASEILCPDRQPRYSLDSLRDQFIANACQIYQPAEVDALVGDFGAAIAMSEDKQKVRWLDNEIGDIPVPMPDLVTRMRQMREQYERRQKVQKLRRKWKEKTAVKLTV